MNSLTSQQKRTLTFLIGTVLLLAASGWMIYDLSIRRTEVTRLKQETERKENEARNLQLPTLEEQVKWTEYETRLKGVLLTEEALPKFFEEVTRIANENGLQRLGLNSEETVIDTNKQASPEEARLLGVGVRRYLVVTVKFQGDYPDVARFLGGITKLQRPVEFHMVDLRRGAPLIDATVVMNVYKREGA